MKRWSKRWIDTSQYKTKEILLSVIGDYVSDLKPANKKETQYVCTCPFHNEKTPSLKIHNHRGKTDWCYKCLGCGLSGDVFKFLMRTRDWKFWDAVAYMRRYVPALHNKKRPHQNPCQLEFPFPFDAEEYVRSFRTGQLGLSKQSDT